MLKIEANWRARTDKWIDEITNYNLYLVEWKLFCHNKGRREEKRSVQQCSRRLMKLTLSYFSLRRFASQRETSQLPANYCLRLIETKTRTVLFGIAEANRPMRLLPLSSELQMALLILIFHSVRIYASNEWLVNFRLRVVTSKTKPQWFFHVNNIASVSWLIHGKSHKLHMLFIGRLEQLANG